MARIIENENGRRIIKLSCEDILSIVREYQCIVARHAPFDEMVDCLKDRNIYIPEDI